MALIEKVKALCSPEELAEFTQLYNDSLFLDCLQNAGVDNWEGYDIAREEYEPVEF